MMRYKNWKYVLLIIGLLLITGCGKSENKQTEESEKSVASYYSSYLKKNFDDYVSLAFIDFNNDDIKEMIVYENKNEDRIIEIDSLNEDNEIETLDINKYGYLELVYDPENEKTMWFIVTEDKDFMYYDVNDCMKKGKFDFLVSFMKEKYAQERYPSFDAKVNYYDVNPDDATSDIKKILKEESYTSGKSLSEIKEEVEEFNRPKTIHCTMNVKTDGKYKLTAEIYQHYEKNYLNSVDFIYTLDFSSSPKNVDIDATVNSQKRLSESHHGISFSKERKSSTSYVLKATLTKDNLSKAFDPNTDFSFYAAENDVSLGFDNGMECKIS